MKRLMPAALAMLLVPSIALADSPPRPEMNLALDDYSIELKDFNFPSGLRIIFQEDHTQPIVSITSVIDRGASHDPVGKEGIAHLVEHMWFQSKHGDLPKVWDVLEEFGANLNASTASDWTNYMTVASSSATVPLLRLEALRMENAIEKVTESDLAEEREVVRNELRMRYENTSSTFLYYLRAKLYPVGHPYHRLGIGTHDSLNNIELADVQAFVDKNYTPENTTIVVVGDFDITATDPETGETYNNAWRMIQQAFPMELLLDPDDPEGELEMRDPPIRVDASIQEEPPEVADPEMSYHKGGTEKPTLFAGWTLPGGYTPEDITAQMAVGAMNQAIQTYLNEDFDIFSDDISDIENAGCFYWAEEVNSTAICYAEMGDEADAPDKLENMLDGLYKMWEISDSELVRTYQKVIFDNSRLAQMAYIFRSVEIVSSIGNGRAADTANFTHFTGDPLYYSRSFEALNNVDMKEVREFAQKYLNRDRAAAVVVAPYGEDDVVLDSSDAIYKGAVRRETTYSMIDLTEVNAEMLEGIMSPPNLAEKREFDLDNGIHVVLVPYGEAPILQVAAYFKTASWTAPKTGLNTYVNRWLDYDYHPVLPLAGTYYDGGADQWTSQGVSGSSANYEGLTWLLRKRVESLRPNVNDRRTYIVAAKKSVRYNRTFPEYWQGVIEDTHLYEGHPLGFVEDELYYDAMTNISQPEMQSWVNGIYRPTNTTLYVVGRMDDPDAVEAAVRANWNGWEVRGEAVEWPDRPAPPEPKDRAIVVIDKERVTQTAVRLACQTGPATMENHEARQELAGLMDRSAWVALREQAGVTYGAGSYSFGYNGGAANLYFSSLVQNDAVGLAVDVFLDMSKRAFEGDLDEDRLTVNKLGSARKYVLGHQTSGQMLSRIASAQTSGYGWDYINGHAERLAAVRIEDVKAMAQRCYEHEIITIIGPAAVVTPQLDELGVEYTVFDWREEKERLFRENDPKEYKKAKKKEAREAKKKAKKEAKEGAK